TGRIPTSCLKKYSLNRVSNFMGSLHKQLFIDHVAKILKANFTELERTVTLFTHNELGIHEQGEQLEFLGVNTS
ncbi:hypothetical protein, partial [Ligilactobacillus murinus]|uniref:hypothetical protein n=1 Tax=Ligilactobacillus murinus TaxID=1622 RepID=UPI000EC94079